MSKHEMNDLTLDVVTSSNVCGVIPLIKLFHDGRYCGMVLVLCATVSSILMHLSETKHGLNPGPRMKIYSTVFLNVDRFFALLTACYGLWLFYNNPTKTWIQVALPIAGAIMGAIGESTTNLLVYMVTHCFWHFSAYSAIKLVSF